MGSDRLRQVAIVATYLVTLLINGAANALPINGQRTADISDRFAVFVIPAGYVFSIWGVIYVLLGAFTVWQALPRNLEAPSLRAIGWLPALANLLNAGWVVLFHYEAFVLTVPVMIALLVVLIAIHLRLWALRASLVGAAYWAVRVPFSVYLGWITVATIANIAQTGQALGVDILGLPPALVAAAVLVVGLAIAVRFVTRFDDWAYGLVIAWAYTGIAVKEASTPVVAWVALAGGVLVLVLAVRAVLGRRLRGGVSPAAA